MEIVILCAYGSRTGGPEALHQLADSLNTAGHDVCIWYVDQTDLDLIARLGTIEEPIPLQQRDCVVEEYHRYNAPNFTRYDPRAQLVFVVPESMANLIPMLQRHKVVLWWLSFDYASAAISQINFNFLRAPYVAHAAQSHYAMGCVSALGLSPQLLTDYTVTPPIPSPTLSERPLCIALNANHKVIIDVNYLEQRLKDVVIDVEIIRTVNMSRQQIYDTFCKSRLFVELGSLPGNDRMAREALKLGCNLIIGRVGAGAHYEDYPLPDIYRPSPFDVVGVASLAARMITEPTRFAPDFHAMLHKVSEEETRFHQEVVRVFAAYR